ncbi:LysR family transcriptional regulator, partial [Raoultella sp. 18093]|uniref:LysR family transcriptional regulator n=1 Tax=Raoultella sp. 18093 TaxID=2681425 RepID=UPI0013574793
MNLRQIEAFRAVMVTGSVSGAARLLHVSVPPISRLLSHTESRLGFALFERIKGRLHPTAEARRLYLDCL